MAPWTGRQADVEQAYRAVMRRVREVYGESQIALDSSKNLSSLQRVQRFWDGDLDVLFVVRDVRGFVTSTSRFTAHRAGLLGRSALMRTAQWYVTNRRIERFLQSEDIRYLQLGYEELCFHTDATLSMIGNFLGIEPPSAEGLQHSKSHIMQGNKMRYEQGRRDSIEYDYRWFHSLRSELAAMVWPPVHRWNATHAYGNLQRSAEGKSRSRE